MQSLSQQDIFPAAPSPDELIQRACDLQPWLRGQAKHTEELAQVPHETVRRMREAGLFKVLQSRHYGGYEMDPQVFFDIQMTLAEACMSTAWIYGVIGVHNWQLALFDAQASADVWADDPNVLIASSYMPKGEVVPVDGGYQFSGRWGYSSGIDHCDWVLLGGLLPPVNAESAPEYRTFLVPRTDFEVLETWDTMGLRGTGSKDVVVASCFVPEHRTHKANDGFAGTSPGLKDNPGSLYKLPFGQIFVRAVSSSAIGALQGIINSFTEFARQRVGDMGTRTAEQPTVQVALARASVAVDEMKLVLRRNFDDLMRLAEQGEAASIDDRLRYRCQAAMVLERCSEHASALFSAAGARGIFNDFEVGRHFLNIQAGRSHYANNPEMFARNYGGVMLGHDNTDFFI